MERLILEFTLRATLIALASALVLAALRIRRAATRHAVWTGVLAAMLTLPVWISWGPKASLPLLPAPNPIIMSAEPAPTATRRPPSSKLSYQASRRPPATSTSPGSPWVICWGPERCSCVWPSEPSERAA